MSSDKYNMSFTAGALFQRESVEVASLYLKVGDWGKVRDTVVSNNITQSKTTASNKRTSREICLRLMHCTKDELEFLVDGDHQEQSYLLWVAICRHHCFLYEFSVEVIRERFLTFRYDLVYEDFDAFFNAKMEWHEELEKITDTTRNKLRQVLFRMLREAELVNADNSIIPATLSSRFINVICSYRSEDLQLFPVMDAGPKACAQ